jgi:hypothetical protein
MAKLAIRTRLMCGEFHCSDSRETDHVPVVLVVSLMFDLAHTFFFPTVLRAVVPVAEQTVLHVSDGLQIGMLFTARPHTITDKARQHIRLFGCLEQSNSDDVCPTSATAAEREGPLARKSLAPATTSLLHEASVVSQSQKHDFLLDMKLTCVTQGEMPL